DVVVASESVVEEVDDVAATSVVDVVVTGPNVELDVVVGSTNGVDDDVEDVVLTVEEVLDDEDVEVVVGESVLVDVELVLDVDVEDDVVVVTGSGTQRENSDVLPFASVAVAVRNSDAATVRESGTVKAA